MAAFQLAFNVVNNIDWFHVAVTYNGNAGSTNNLKLYWTRLLPSTPTPPF